MPTRADPRPVAGAGAAPHLEYPPDLPVSGRREEIVAALREQQVLVVAGETGSGKTTQLPKMCLEAGRGQKGMIAHTQPRRIAARTVAERLADELRVELGGVVGYQVRFDATVSDETVVKVMTDGVLLAELRRDKLLRAYDTIIVDEAHERSLNIDFLLGSITQLLPRRPELSVVITSATIDTARFAAHFGAPVIEVSGRTYPVEIRYRPLAGDGPGDGAGDETAADRAANGAGGPAAGGRGEDRDPTQAICDAVAELCAEGPGDILVFLPGERDIRDAADALRSAAAPALQGIDVLPLYARLTAAEQHKVFRPHRGRRVVLSTNVAETSLTVPGIRAVVDTGLARISRYNHRSKVQRLPIEPISRASADQRAGRCGRLGPGTCIRLYSAEDYLARPQFTDPEILRTNLASVILQMAAIGLGEVETFPFLEPPDRRQVADGRALLAELGALEQRNGRPVLTGLGRRLAELPVDPRLGRMVLEAERRGCVREVIVIAAALSIPDPRERPAEHSQQAAGLHNRFEVPDSDFLTLLRLWEYLAELQRELSGNQFRRRCRAEFLNVMRIRDWQDLVSQLRQALRERRWRDEGSPGRNRARLGSPRRAEDPLVPVAPEQIHQALLAGLLSQIGARDRLRDDYQGARNTRFVIARGSALARRRPPWVMAGELVETERMLARTCARIDPVWAERLGAHLLKRSAGEPWWDDRRAEAMVEERATLYGLPVVERRPISLAGVDPAEARAWFVQRALVEGDWDASPEPLERNAARVARIARLEERVRRRLQAASDEALYAFYDARLPAEVTSGRRFERWWREAGRADPALLDVPWSVLLGADAGTIDLDGYPDSWPTLGVELPLRYRFEPGADDDGVTVELPLLLVNRVDRAAFDWHVPGMRHALVTGLIRSLPKQLRRAFVPAPDVAAQVLGRAGPAGGPLLPAVAATLSILGGIEVLPEDFDLSDLDPYLRVRVEVVDGGQVVATGRDLGRLARSLRGEVRRALSRAVPGVERHGLRSWEVGDLPRRIERGQALAFPALVDEGETAGVVLLESERGRDAAMWAGERRLLLLALPLPMAHVERRLTNDTKLALARAGWPLADLVADCAAAVGDRLLAAAGAPVFEQAAFEAIVAAARDGFSDRVIRVSAIAGGVLSAAAEVEARAAALERATASAAPAPGAPAAGPPIERARLVEAALADVRSQVASLVHPGFVSSVGSERLGDVLRYLRAASRRLERLPGDARRDGERRARVAAVARRYERLLASTSWTGPPIEDPRRAVRFMIEELRVSLWAQDLGTSGPVSEQRIGRAIADLGG